MENYYLCPLYFFECNEGEIQLPENIKIKKTPREFTEYLDQAFGHYLRTMPTEALWTIMIQVTPIPVTISDPLENIKFGLREEQKAIEKLEDVITSLRLHKQGRVVAGLLISASLNDSNWNIGGTTVWTSVSNINFFKEDPLYELKNIEMSNLILLFQLIREWRNNNTLKTLTIALERFHSSYHGNIEDRLIDQMIAFESLYLGNEQELTYKLAMRTAFLLRKRKDHRKIVFKNMKTSYRYRSKIVHGDNPPDRIELKSVVFKMQDYLRESIKKIFILLSQGKSLREIRENLLDDNIITNGKTLVG
jgi:hypothetical protein